MKISVAMTTYNGERYLREQLDSILAQSRLPDELIVCDDQSTDATPSILEEYAARSPFAFKVRINDTRLGSTKNFEQAIGLCTGDIICLSDQDDVWRSHKLNIFEERFHADPRIGLIFTNGDLIDEQSRPLKGDLWSSFLFNHARRKAVQRGDWIDLIISLPFITGATAAFRSEFNSLVLPVPDEIPTFIHDRWTAVLISAVSPISMVEEKLIAYRRHPNQQLGTGKLSRYLNPHRCASDQLALRLVRERLAARSSWKPSQAFLDRLTVRERHIAVRAELSNSMILRGFQLAQEYLIGGYRQFPLGLRTALKDMLVGTR